MSRTSRYSRTAIHGMSLVELMLAMALGLVVTGAAVALFSTNRMTYTVSENLGRMQESSRTAFELMSRDIRDGGGTPCDNASDFSFTNGLSSPTANWWTNWDNGMRGYTGATAFPDAAFGTTTLAQRVAGTDAIEIKAGEVTNSIVTAESPADVPPGNTARAAAIQVSTVTGLTVNDILILCDYRGGTIFKATSFAGNTILHATGGSPANAASTLAKVFPVPDPVYPTGQPPAWARNATIAKLRATRWYIGCNLRAACTLPTGRSLFQSSLLNTAGTLSIQNDEVAQGISGMTLEYLQTGGNAYVAATGVTDWTRVIAVKITLTITGDDRVGTDGARLSRTLQHVVSLRNHLT